MCATRIYRLLRRDSHDDGSMTKGFCGFFHHNGSRFHRNNSALISQLITDISTSLTFSLILLTSSLREVLRIDWNVANCL